MNAIEIYDNANRKLNKSEITLGEYERMIDPLRNVIPILEGATNGDMIKAMFPYIKIREHEKTDICDAYIQIDIWDFSICVSKDWWNAPYKEVN